jgi:hypothetical protein
MGAMFRLSNKKLGGISVDFSANLSKERQHFEAISQ